jgi:hypothetical protein
MFGSQIGRWELGLNSLALAVYLPSVGFKLDLLDVAAVTYEQRRVLPETIQRYPLAGVMWMGNPQASYLVRLLRAEVAQLGIEPRSMEPGTYLDLGIGCTCTR